MRLYLVLVGDVGDTALAVNENHRAVGSGASLVAGVLRPVLTHLELQSQPVMGLPLPSSFFVSSA
jgi:hypothetical protein